MSKKIRKTLLVTAAIGSVAAATYCILKKKNVKIKKDKKTASGKQDDVITFEEISSERNYVSLQPEVTSTDATEEPGEKEVSDDQSQDTDDDESAEDEESPPVIPADTDTAPDAVTEESVTGPDTVSEDSVTGPDTVSEESVTGPDTDMKDNASEDDNKATEGADFTLEEITSSEEVLTEQETFWDDANEDESSVSFTTKPVDKPVEEPVALPTDEPAKALSKIPVASEATIVNDDEFTPLENIAQDVYSIYEQPADKIEEFFNEDGETSSTDDVAQNIAVSELLGEEEILMEEDIIQEK